MNTFAELKFIYNKIQHLFKVCVTFPAFLFEMIPLLATKASAIVVLPIVTDEKLKLLIFKDDNTHINISMYLYINISLATKKKRNKVI